MLITHVTTVGRVWTVSAVTHVTAQQDIRELIVKMVSLSVTVVPIVFIAEFVVLGVQNVLVTLNRCLLSLLLLYVNSSRIVLPVSHFTLTSHPPVFS